MLKYRIRSVRHAASYQEAAGSDAQYGSPPSRGRRPKKNARIGRFIYFTASFGAGCAPDFAQNFHQAASPLPLPSRKRLFG